MFGLQGHLQEPPVLADVFTPSPCVPGCRGPGLSESLIGMPGKSLALGGGPGCRSCGGGLITGLMVQWAGHQTGHLETWGLVQLAAALLGDLKQITWPLSAPSAPCLLPVWQDFLEGILMGWLTEAQILQHLSLAFPAMPGFGSDTQEYFLGLPQAWPWRGKLKGAWEECHSLRNRKGHSDPSGKSLLL